MVLTEKLHEEHKGQGKTFTSGNVLTKHKDRAQVKARPEEARDCV